MNVVRVAQTNQYNQVATYFGTLQPGQRARLAFGSPGKVALVSKTSGQKVKAGEVIAQYDICLLYTSPSPRDQRGSRMPSSA